jgi:hypothetical protein
VSIQLAIQTPERSFDYGFAKAGGNSTVRFLGQSKKLTVWCALDSAVDRLLRVGDALGSQIVPVKDVLAGKFALLETPESKFKTDPALDSLMAWLAEDGDWSSTWCPPFLYKPTFDYPVCALPEFCGHGVLRPQALRAVCPQPSMSEFLVRFAEMMMLAIRGRGPILDCLAPVTREQLRAELGNYSRLTKPLPRWTQKVFFVALTATHEAIPVERYEVGDLDETDRQALQDRAAMAKLEGRYRTLKAQLASQQPAINKVQQALKTNPAIQQGWTKNQQRLKKRYDNAVQDAARQITLPDKIRKYRLNLTEERVAVLLIRGALGEDYHFGFNGKPSGRTLQRWCERVRKLLEQEQDVWRSLTQAHKQFSDSVAEVGEGERADVDASHFTKPTEQDDDTEEGGTA